MSCFDKKLRNGLMRTCGMSSQRFGIEVARVTSIALWMNVRLGSVASPKDAGRVSDGLKRGAVEAPRLSNK
jgi:hypothetical protein